MKAFDLSNIWPTGIIALTGTVGSGKSTVGKLLSRMGAYVVSADELAREVVQPKSVGLTEVVKAFGSSILTPAGELDRRKLGEIIFSDPEQRVKVERILHPFIRALARERFASAPEAPLYVYDVPLFFEAKLDRNEFRKILLVAAPPEVCVRRIITRDHLSEREAWERIAAQIPVEAKRGKADIVIENTGTLAELEHRVREIFEQLRQ